MIRLTSRRTEAMDTSRKLRGQGQPHPLTKKPPMPTLLHTRELAAIDFRDSRLLWLFCPQRSLLAVFFKNR